MKKTIIFLGMVCMATTALAFGGGGSGHNSTRYNRHNPGVDNFGVHIHPDNPPLDIRFYDIKNDAYARPCQEGANVYCCEEGYVVDVATSKCVACPSGSVATLDENFNCTVCEGEMIPNQDKSSCIMPEPPCEGTVCGENCCPTGATCGENNECCQGEICAEAGQELYCYYINDTNAQGECEDWRTCAEGKSTGDSIIGMSGAYGACAGEGQELYCIQMSSSVKKCYEWGVCAKGKSTGHLTDDVKGALGACAEDNEEVYCEKTDPFTGDCYDWGTCPKGRSSTDKIVGTKDASGMCVGAGKEVYCVYTNDNGQCGMWYECAKDKSSGTSIIGTPNANGTCNE